jgi:hypothetical protein
MVPLGLRYRAHAIHECQGGLEVRKHERLGDVMLGDHFPIRYLGG